jgi:hypothetical protein
LDVTEGLAIDSSGKEIWWSGGAPKPLGSADDGAYLIIEWIAQESDEYSQMAGKYLRLIDTCKFSFKGAAEANDVVLAKISVRDGQPQPDNSVRRSASNVRANAGDLEIRPVTSDGSLRLMTGAPSTARLMIDAKGNVGLGTPPTAARLSIDAPPYEGTLMDFAVAQYKLTLGYRSIERDTVSYHFDLKNNLGEFNKFLVFHKGNVGIGTPKPSFALQVGDVDTVGTLKLCVAGRGSTGNYRQWTLRTGDGADAANIHKLRIRDEQANADRFIIDENGNVGIANDLTVTGALSGARLSTSDIRLRADDGNHGISYFGQGAAKEVGDFAIDGPVLYGYHGGALGIRQGETRKVALRWDDQGKVGIGTTNPQAPLVVSNKGAKVSMLKLLNPNGAAGDQWWLGFDHGADSTDDNDRARVGVDILGGGAGRLFFTTGLAKQQQERMRIDESGNVGIGTPDPKSKLDVQGAANIWSGARYAVPNNFMAPASLTVGNINSNFGGGTSGWNTNTAGLLLETLDNTEIAVHDSNKRVASLMYYEGGDVNRITIGRQMDPSWGAISTLALNGNVGIGTTDPGKSKLRIANSSTDFAHFRFDSAGGGEFEIVSWANGWNINSKTAGKNLHINRDTSSDVLIGQFAKELIVKGDTGNVGIGTTNPTRGRVEIIGSVRSSFAQLGYLTSFNVATDVYNPTVRNGTVQVPVGLVGSNEGPISLYADNIIAAASTWSFSDERIKLIEGRSDAARDLFTLMRLEVIDYRYKDVIGKGATSHKKVIAQQVEKVFPQAVSKQTDVVPDIYQLASFIDGWVELATDLKTGERVRLISDKAEGVYKVLEATQGKFRTDFQPEGGNVFVFGREVDDFRTLDYDAIAMLNVSATQQLKKEKDEEVKGLRTEIVELKAADDALIKRLQMLESKMETAAGVAVAKTSNGNGRH